MEAVKAMFYAFRDRVESVGGGHHLGLVQFDSAIDRLLDLTPELHRFEAIVDDVEPRGQTSIYSSIVEGVRMLEPHFSPESPTDLRVLVLTDGQNNCGAPPEDALAAVDRIGAVVDAIIVGDQPDSFLRQIVSATGGECYQIGSLGEGFELLEAESVVSLRARRGGQEKPPFRPRETIDFSETRMKDITRGSSVKRAPAPADSFATKKVVDVASFQKDAAAAASQPSSAKARRLLKELAQVHQGDRAVFMHSGAGIHVFPAQDAMMSFWRALIEGPENSPFEGGVFVASVEIPDAYPLNPPRITLDTPIYHCNVSDSGKLCLDILMDRWSASLTIPKCLEAIRLMMGTPDTNNALRQWIAEVTLAHINSGGEDTRYYDQARELTQQEASKSVEEWKQEWSR
jgi:ubiquitin-protein ligase